VVAPSPLSRIALADLFCGLGGTSEGARQAGIVPTIAINHNPAAIRGHIANHPDTEHFQKDIHDISPLAAARGRRIHAVWCSASCTHFSRAKGAAPLDRQIRELSWVLCDWARDLRPAVLFYENVPEVQTWGPLDDEGYPIEERKGETWRAFLARLEGLGYRVEWRVIVAADHGAPTIRERLHLIARRDGLPIEWPEPTHAEGGGGGLLPWRGAWECIDFDEPVPSIFLSPAEAREWGRAHGRRAPKRPLAEATQRRIAEGARRFVFEDPEPFLVKLYGTSTVASLGAPLPTVTATGQHLGLAIPALVNTRNGERIGQAPRVRDVRDPMPTVTAAGSQGGVALAWLAKHNGSGERWNAAIGQSLRATMDTITARDTKALCVAHLGDTGGADRSRHVAAFITSFYSEGGTASRLSEPMRTIVTKARHGLVTVEFEGDEWSLVDLGMRMLRPRELARAQGFPESYQLLGTLEEQIAGIGNSQSPIVARRLFEANLDERVAAEEPRGLFGWGADQRRSA
jgi:DNA (cytosine-5)-methyltransferase 1